MFRIREDQLAWFAEKSRRAFVERMADYLAAEFASCVERLAREELVAWVSAAVALGERRGVTTEPEVAQLVLLLLVLGLDAEKTTPWVKETLANRELYAAGKVNTLVRLAREHGVAGVEAVVVRKGAEAHAGRGAA